jgi:hypothetical protein
MFNRAAKALNSFNLLGREIFQRLLRSGRLRRLSHQGSAMSAVGAGGYENGSFYIPQDELTVSNLRDKDEKGSTRRGCELQGECIHGSYD